MNCKLLYKFGWGRLAILGFSLILLQGVSAQNGNYFISNLIPTDERIDPRSTGIVQSELGVIYFTNKNGILEFDGNNWRLIPTPGSVYSIVASGNKIFAGGSFGFGVLVNSAGKNSEFQLISGKPNIFSTIVIQDKIFYCSESEIFAYNISSGTLDKASITAGESNFFLGVYVIGEQPYVSTLQRGLLRIENGTLSSEALPLPEGETIIFSISAEADGTFLGTDHGKLYQYKSSTGVQPVTLKEGEYIEHHGLINAARVGNLLALGTLKGGVIFIDPKTGTTQEIIDYHIGLPDDDVLAIFTDRDDGVWVAHEYGFSRIDPSLPFRSFNHYPGLSGNLLCVKEVEGTLFVGTSLGLYYLKTEDQYEDVEVIQRITRIAKSTASTNTNTTTETSSSPQQDKTRKKLFGFLRKKKTDEPEPAASTSNKNPTPTNAGKPKTETVITKTTKRILKSRQYVYQKVDGITGKVTQLIDFNGKTIAAGLGGVFTLTGTQVQPVIKEPVRFVFHSTLLDQLFISTFDDRTITFAPGFSGWEETHYADTLHDYISYIFEDNQANIWFCGKTQVYKMELVDGAVSALKSLPISNPLFDETVGISLGHDVYVAASGTFMQYDGANGFLKYDSLPGPKRYFASAGNFWFNDGHRWKTITQKLQNLKLEWLGIFPNLRYLSPSNDGQGLWMVTAENELYKFSNPTDEQLGKFYPLFLKDVRGEQIKLIENKNLKMDQSENAVYFEFTQPNYLGFRATEFRYMVHGLTKEWSEWSNVNNLVSFSYLPPGEYQLAIQSRDLLGNESPVELISFEVLPYYWKRWWFYALEFSFFSMLVLLSIRLGRSNSRYRVISQILSLLTVILMIQFIETGIDSMLEFKSSPVVEFLIQLGITLVVFPVETKLQALMQYVKERKYKGLEP
jgi:hypothetical protein